MRCVTLFSVLALSAGCNPSSSIDGVWMLSLEPAAESTERTVTDNFMFAQPYMGAGDASNPAMTTYESRHTGEVVPVRIVGAAGTQAFATFDGRIIPGARDGGDWVFDLDVQDEDLEHQENFDYVYDWSSVVSNRLQLRFDSGGKRSTGSLVTSVTQTETWAEPDLWMQGQSYSRIPAEEYLVPTSTQYTRAENRKSEAECTDSMCTMQVSTVTALTQSFTAVRTELHPDDVIEIGSPSPSANTPPEYYDTGWY
jgi:hypothetical protein